MSATPRTDHNVFDSDYHEVVTSQFARELERELAEAHRVISDVTSALETSRACTRERDRRVSELERERDEALAVFANAPQLPEGDREVAALASYAELSRALLRRIYAWDMMDSASDGPYWRKEIDTVLAGDHPGEVCKEDGRMHLDWCLSLNGEKCNCVPETGKKPMQEAQERIQRDMATKGTARAQDVFTILGDPSKGVTVHNPEWPCRILGPEEDELRHQSCTHSETPRTDAILEIASIEDRYLPLLDLARELEARTEFQVGREHAESLAHALSVALPMVKGYAAEHRVGRNGEIAQWVADRLQDWIDAGYASPDTSQFVACTKAER